MKLFTGVLKIFTADTTEGYWAFQDEKFIDRDNHDRRCTRCGHIWASDAKDEPQPNITDVNGPDEPLLAKWKSYHNDLLRICIQEGHDWNRIYPQGKSAFAGLHLLQSGDRLTILDPNHPTRVVWDGEISFPQPDPFTEDLIHADQAGIDRQTWSTWFMKGYPAQLTTAG